MTSQEPLHDFENIFIEMLLQDPWPTVAQSIILVKNDDFVLWTTATVLKWVLF